MAKQRNEKPTQEQIDQIVTKYSKKNVLDILFSTSGNTLNNLCEALKYGLKPSRFSPDIEIVELEKLFSHFTVKSNRQKHKIIENILQFLFDKNVSYFRKVGKSIYAINEIFIVDFLIHNKSKWEDLKDIWSIYSYIQDFDNFTKVIEIFYLPYNKKETKYTARQFFKAQRPYKYSLKKQFISSEKTKEEQPNGR